MKNKGFNKQGLEKAGINMSLGNGQVILTADQRTHIERQKAQQEIQSLVNFRSTCAMNNLGCLITADPEGLRTKNALAKDAKEYAEELMVELRMIPTVEFFRELEAHADAEHNPKPSIVTE